MQKQIHTDCEVVFEKHVVCDGGGYLGHPKVALEVKHGMRYVECPYCSKKFVYDNANANSRSHDSAKPELSQTSAYKTIL